MQAQATVDPLFLAFQLALAGRYSIDRELGRGGMGIVFLAREVHLDRQVAIKLLPPERAQQPGFRDRFLREAQLAAKLSHPNIIPIHAVEQAEGFVYYVMAFVDGETLAQRVRTRGPLPSSEGARVLREVAWALAYAHGQGVVHRDVKPDNILLEAGTNRALVADFGIAAAAGDASADGIAGTPEFMSPEQALGRPIDARSDIYGLGATAFFAFSGRFPFEGATPTQVLAKQVTEAPPQLAAMGLTIQRKLASIVDRCLAKDPEQRPPSAQALAEQLGVALEQRREMPAALRAFVKRYGRLDGGGTLIASISLFPVSLYAANWGIAAGFTTFFVGLTATPMAYLIWAARRLTRLGFAHRDVGPAFQAEIEQAREELSVEQRRGPSALEVLTRRIAKFAGVLGVGGILLMIPRHMIPLPMALYHALFFADYAPIAIGVSAWAMLGYLALRQRHQDVESEFWARVWRSRVGRLAFAIARRLVGSGARATAMTHRATELSLGLAAEQLYDALPKESRHALRDLPALLHRLQEDAQALRGRYEDLQEALAESGDAAASATYAELRSLRDETHAKLGDAVGALENIRLNLLRLHAGSATVDGITTHLGVAAEVSAQVERLIAAHEEVERHIQFPRMPAVTPV